jgi:hypothetical protein
MPTSGMLRGRRHLQRGAILSGHGGKAILTILALGGVAVWAWAPWLRLSAGLEPTVEVAGLALAGICGAGVLAGLITSLISKRATDDDPEAAEWFRSLAAEGTWWEQPSGSGRLQAAEVAVVSHSGSTCETDHEDIRADERQRVLVVLRAMQRRAADDPAAAPALRDFALRTEAAVALLDSPRIAGRRVPPLPSARPSVARPAVQAFPSPDASVPADVPAANAGPPDRVPDAGGMQQPWRESGFAMGEVISPPLPPRTETTAQRRRSRG